LTPIKATTISAGVTLLTSEPRDSGRYQGAFDAVFVATAVLGPLLGGVLVDHLSWRRIFYLNIPIGVVALVVITKGF
jgi:MFS family permease